ncbi:MAG: hypothetical protein WD118_05170 [Phycisphaeraceae bacterium]
MFPLIRYRRGVAVLALALPLLMMDHTFADRETDRLQPWAEDARYWQYRGQPILLIGASNEDNLFNHPELPPDGLAAHLDRMAAVGGNYVRNTMSSRDDGNVWPFARDPQTGLYDLHQLGDAYWHRFEQFLATTAERGIIVQIEVWDRFDFAREPWQNNPFNPKNNVNYTAAVSGLPERIDTHPGQRENPFFRSIPELEDNALIRPFQKAIVQRMLDISLPHDHVIYCISNETNDSEQWSRYWARFLRSAAERHGVGIEVTEMWDMWDMRHAMHARTFDHPDVYSFVDVSQNSHQQGQMQWDRLQWVRQRVADPPRPVNSVKMYGGHHGGGPDEGQHKLWRNILGGTASARYHRPGGGMGLNDVTTAHLRSLGMVRERVNLFAMAPANELLIDRNDDEAYLAAEPGRQYVAYFPNGGRVTLDFGDGGGRRSYRMQWLDVLSSDWGEPAEATGERVTLEPPDEGPWAIVLVRHASD